MSEHGHKWDTSHPDCWTWGRYSLTRITILAKQKWELWEDNRRLHATFVSPDAALDFAVERARNQRDLYMGAD